MVPKSKLPSYLYYPGPNEEGTFKLPGNAKNVATIKKGLDDGLPLNKCGALGDTLSIAVVLTEFLQQLPSPLIPEDLAPQYIAASGNLRPPLFFLFF